MIEMVWIFSKIIEKNIVIFLVKVTISNISIFLINQFVLILIGYFFCLLYFFRPINVRFIRCYLQFITLDIVNILSQNLLIIHNFLSILFHYHISIPNLVITLINQFLIMLICCSFYFFCLF